MVNSEELIGNTEYLTLYTRCRINLRRYNRVRLYNYKPLEPIGNYMYQQDIVYFDTQCTCFIRF
jgi:hypothetical protein